MDMYDRQGNPITMEEFSRLLGDPEYKILRQTNIGDTLISTVWLGLDHNWGDGPPLIFETMVFDMADVPDDRFLGPAMDEYVHRYSTEEEALAGHLIMVEELTRLFDVDTAIIKLTESDPS